MARKQAAKPRSRQKQGRSTSSMKSSTKRRTNAKSSRAKLTSRSAAVKRPKVGSSARAAKSFGGKNDFGAPEADVIGRQYASSAAKSQDKGAAPPRSSGGDLDPDIIGVGTGGDGVAASGGTDRTEGPDIIEGSQDTFAARTRSRGRSHIDPKKREVVRGSTVDRSGGDETSTGGGQGAAAANPFWRNDDSFAGEVSLDEAAGADNSPSEKR